MKQLFETVKSLFAIVATLTNNKNQIKETVGQSNANLVNQTESETLRLAIIAEIKEMKEREKIVVKGFEVPSGREFMEVFMDVWKHILGPDHG